MSYRGDLRLGDTLDVKFATVSTAAVPTTLGGTPAVAAYVDNGTIEITAGITLSVDFDGRTGLHNVRVVATAGNGFATQTNVDLVITAGTVGGVSVVGMVVGSFSIGNRSAQPKKNQALANFTFLMTLAATHAPATGLAVTVTRRIDNGAFAAGTLSAVTEVGNGIYSVDFAAADLNGDVVTLRATAALADDTFDRIVTHP